MVTKRNILIILILLNCYIPVRSEVFKVSTVNELDAAVASVVPGDTVLLAARNWADVSLELKGVGSENAPIVYGAVTPGQTFFTGNSRIQISGQWLVVRDFIFRDGNLSSSGSIIEFRTDSKTFAHNCRLTNVEISNYNPAVKSTDSKYISLYGTYNRVDHCSFHGKNNSGATLVVWLDETPDYHRIDHNYFGPREDLGVNGGETIRIGTSDWESYNSNCVVEYNLFDECDGEIEIISNKSVGNHYRYNTFENCEGTLTLRHGSDCWVYGNFFFGNLDKNCGGIRIIGPGHRVFNNYLENLNGTSYRAAICLMNGVPNSPANRYRQVEDARIGFNTIVNCKEPFAIGAGKDSEKSLAPANSSIENCLVISREGRELVKDYDSADGVAWNGIFTDASTIGITADGFVQTTLPMVLNGKMMVPTAENPVINAALTGVYDTLAVDIDGQTRPDSDKDAGCDEVMEGEKPIHPLSKKEVGAYFTANTAVHNFEKPKYNIRLQNKMLIVIFDDDRERTVSLFALNGKLLSSSKITNRNFSTAIDRFPRMLIVDIREAAKRYSFKLVR